MFPNTKFGVRGALAALVVALAFPALAAADSPDVTSATGSIVSVDGAGNQTVEVHGTWAWPTHGGPTDCNTDRAGVGIAIDWGDDDPQNAGSPNGFHVTTLGNPADSIDVGVLHSYLGNAVDNLVHPAEPYPGSYGDLNANSTATWRATCGVFDFGPLLVGKKYSQGTFGTYLDAGRSPTTGPAGEPTHFLTHVYPPGPIPQICALTYDIHGNSSNSAPTNSIIAGGNGHNADNSAEANGNHVVGNVCADVKGLKPPPPPPQCCAAPPPPPNPAIKIDKTGPATAVAGSPIPYLIVITNIGNVSFDAAKVDVQDPLCSAAPTLIDPGGKNGDTTPNTFDPGESWYYTCSVPTAAGQTAAIHNVATVTATPAVGAAVSDDDPADTQLTQPQQPAQAVLPLLPGSARLRGPAGCLAGGPHKLVVSGRRIRTVTFFLDGKKVAVRTKADKHGRFTYTVNRKHLRSGIHTIVARVTYLPETVGGARTFRRTFAKCARALKPEFTG